LQAICPADVYCFKRMSGLDFVRSISQWPKSLCPSLSSR
jgi:hypothetical protein